MNKSPLGKKIKKVIKVSHYKILIVQIRPKQKSKSKKRRNKTKIFHDDLWKKKQLLIDKYVKQKKYRGGTKSFYNNDKFNTLDFGAHQIHDPFKNGLYIDDFSNTKNQDLNLDSRSTDNLSPSFDNNVLGNDPFGRLRKYYAAYNRSNSGIRTTNNIDFSTQPNSSIIPNSKPEFYFA